MSLVAKIPQPTVVLFGSFPTAVRQYVVFDSVITPPRWEFNQSSTILSVPPGVYLYELLHGWQPSSSWTSHYEGEVLAEEGMRKVIRFPQRGRILYRDLPPASGSKVLLRITPL